MAVRISRHPFGCLLACEYSLFILQKDDLYGMILGSKELPWREAYRQKVVAKSSGLFDQLQKLL